MHSQQRIRNNILTDYGHRRIVYLKRKEVERNGWSGRDREKRAPRLSGKEERMSSGFFLFTILLSSRLFSLLLDLFFVFYDTSIGRQIPSGKEEESNTTSFYPTKAVSFSYLLLLNVAHPA